MRIKSKYLTVILVSLTAFYSNESFSQPQKKYGIKLIFTIPDYYDTFDSSEPARNPRFNFGFFIEGQNRNKHNFITGCFGLNSNTINGFIKADPEPCDNSGLNNFKDYGKCNLHYLSIPVTAKFNKYIKETTLFCIMGLQYNILLKSKTGNLYKKYSINFSKKYTSLIIGLGLDCCKNDKFFYNIELIFNKGLSSAYKKGYSMLSSHSFSNYEFSFGVGFIN